MIDGGEDSFERARHQYLAQFGTYRLALADLRTTKVQGHPVYKNLEIRPKGLGVMCGPPLFGESAAG